MELKAAFTQHTYSYTCQAVWTGRRSTYRELKTEKCSMLGKFELKMFFFNYSLYWGVHENNFLAHDKEKEQFMQDT